MIPEELVPDIYRVKGLKEVKTCYSRRRKVMQKDRYNLIKHFLISRLTLIDIYQLSHQAWYAISLITSI